jgi:hypothetical protein
MSFKVGGLGDVGGFIADALLGDLGPAFKAGFVFDLVDARIAKPIETIVLVVNPTRYEITEPFQAELTPTEDNTVVTEETGIIVREIMLEGTFGLIKRSMQGSRESLLNIVDRDGTKVSGTTHFLRLRDLFRKYSDLKKDAAKSPYISMVLHVMKDDDHFIVVPREFTSPRDQRNRVHRIYRMRLTAIGKIEGKKPKPKDKGFFDAVADVSKALNDCRAAFVDLTAAAARIKGRLNFINVLLDQAAAIMTAMGNFVRGVKSALILAPIHYVTQAANAFETMADEWVFLNGSDKVQNDEFTRDVDNALREMSRAFDRVATHPNAFATAGTHVAGVNAVAVAGGVGVSGSALTLYDADTRLTRDDTDDLVAGATLGTRTRNRQGSGRDAGLDITRALGVRRWLVTRTDSLDSISNEVGTEPESIIMLNDLRYPYISEGGGPGIAKPGDSILVPSPTGSPEAEAAGSPSQDNYFTPDDVLFGADLAIDTKRLEDDDVLEIKVDALHGYEDAELVRGLPNVVQGVTIILNTEFAATTAVPDVGLRSAVGEKGTLERVLTASVRLREGLLADDRIVSIESMSVVLDADVLSQEVTPVLIDGRPISLSIPFGKASGAGANTVR